MARVIDTSQGRWQPIRPELTAGISGQTLLDGPTKAVLTRVAPGGRFAPHRDNYGHLFHVISGCGRFQLAEEEYTLSAGMALQVAAGELHGYLNTGPDELLLISLNLAGD